MKIQNKTKKTILADNYTQCNSILSKTIGLMFKPRFTKPLIFIFNKEKFIPLHMHLVFFPIDVLWLDRNKRVVELKRDFRPFRMYSPSKKAQYVIELKKGTIDASKTSNGDLISF